MNLEPQPGKAPRGRIGAIARALAWSILCCWLSACTEKPTKTGPGVPHVTWADLEPAKLAGRGLDCKALIRIYCIQTEAPQGFFRLGGARDLPKSEPSFTDTLRKATPGARIYLMPTVDAETGAKMSVILGNLKPDDADEPERVPGTLYGLGVEIEVTSKTGPAIGAKIKVSVASSTEESPLGVLMITGSVSDDLDLAPGKPAILPMPPLDGRYACVVELIDPAGK